MKSPAQPPPRPILVLSAFAPELVPLRRALRRAAIPASAVACAAAGIGAVDAAIGAARLIAERRPGLVLFIGTAGSYLAAPAIGTAVIGRRLVLASTAVARGDGYLPGPMVRDVAADGGVRLALARASAPRAVVTDVATPLAITTDRRLAARLAAATGAGAENLEAFAVARAAAVAAVPFGVVLGISNRVGPDAHLAWKTHQRAATEAAARVLENFLLTRFMAPIRSAR